MAPDPFAELRDAQENSQYQRDCWEHNSEQAERVHEAEADRKHQPGGDERSTIKRIWDRLRQR